VRKAIAIYGAGGHGREILELLRDLNHATAEWEIIGFLSDDQSLWGNEINGVRVLGGQEVLERTTTPVHLAIGIGSPVTKREVAGRLYDIVAGFPRLIHPTAVWSSSVDFGEGVIVAAGSVLTTNIALGRFAMLNVTCSVSHDCVIGEWATVAPGAHLAGNVSIGEGVDLGAGCTIIQGVSIGRWSIVGAGGVVITDLPPNCTAVGVPSRIIKQRADGWQLQ
jgi:sugar O-acyltransferase (sialic acid O-acetyltransferase NeuD family)